MCFGEPVQPPTEIAARYVFILKILAVLQIVISILNLVASSVFIREGILGLFMALLLYLAARNVSYQNLISYTFISLFFFVTFLVHVMTIVQRGQEEEQINSNTYIFVDACISTAFYFLVAIFTFFPYREFKAVFYSSNSQLDQIMGNINDQQMNAQRDQDGFTYDYGQNVSNDEKSKEQTTFEVFKGKGVRIG